MPPNPCARSSPLAKRRPIDLDHESARGSHAPRDSHASTSQYASGDLLAHRTLHSVAFATFLVTITKARKSSKCQTKPVAECHSQMENPVMKTTIIIPSSK